jgi:protocatechuate 3,4-dioxygenase beta subunit
LFRGDFRVFCRALRDFLCFRPGISGTITGTVTDPNGAVVPGAKVTVKNVDTNIATVVTTNDSGAYTLPALGPEIILFPCQVMDSKPRPVRAFRLELMIAHDRLQAGDRNVSRGEYRSWR